MLLRIQRSVTSWWASTASMSKPSTTRRFPVERSCSESPLHLTTPLRWWVIFSVSGLLHQCSEDTACLCSLCTKDETGKHLSFRCHELDSVFPLLQHILHASLLGVWQDQCTVTWNRECKASADLYPARALLMHCPNQSSHVNVDPKELCCLQLSC